MMDYDPFDTPVCMNKMGQLRCSFDTAIKKLGGVLITDEDNPQNAQLYSYWVRIDDLNNVDKSTLVLRFVEDNNSFCLNLDDAKEFLARLTTVVNAAEAMEEKFFKEMEEIKKEQHKPNIAIKNNVFDGMFEEK